PGAAELVEVVDVVGAEVDLQRVEDVADLDAEDHALGAIDFKEEPRSTGAQAVAQPGQTFGAIAPVGDDVADALELRQSDVTAVLDDQSVSTRGAQAIDGGTAEGGDGGAGELLGAALAQLLGDLIGAHTGTMPLLERLEDHIHRTEIGRVGAEDQRLPADAHGAVHPGDIAGDLVDAGHEPFRAIDGGSIGELHVEDQIPLVLLRNEAGGRG